MTTPRSLPGLAVRTTGFDFLVGEWVVENDRLRAPLTGDREWYTSHATATSTTLHNGAVSVDEMHFPDEGFAGSSFRFHDAATDVWAIHWVTSRDGRLQAPVHGRWRGVEFTAAGADTYDGHPILVNFRWHSITRDAAVWEQFFSDDGGESWERNWVMRWTRV
ncbi:MAG TPA: hypothetical protein VGK78_01190 [Nocardioides sp.]|uniref:hypothetical protein n=1 Tax=Nocardioides sp. TaxID=35761 RepID=UPI002F414808